MIEIMIWTPTRQHFIDGMTSTFLPDGRPLATYYNDSDQETESQLVPVRGVEIDEIGELVKVEATFVNGVMTVPPVVVPGHHVNVRIYGDIEDLLTRGLPQIGTVFERTRILYLIAGLTWDANSVSGEPPGYVGPNEVKLFDPAIVTNRRRVWA